MLYLNFQVISVVGRHSNLEKISFVGHSLGGLVARYAIAVLYEQDTTRKAADENGEGGGDKLSKSDVEEKTRGKIAGLEPMNFITCATPHLGARGHKQVLLITRFFVFSLSRNGFIVIIVHILFGLIIFCLSCMSCRFRCFVVFAAWRKQPSVLQVFYAGQGSIYSWETTTMENLPFSFRWLVILMILSSCKSPFSEF